MGNGMFKIWDTGNARIEEDGGSSGLRDYGACTVAQLFFGYDPDLEQRLQEAAVDDDNFEKSYGDDYFRCVECKQYLVAAGHERCLHKE